MLFRVSKMEAKGTRRFAAMLTLILGVESVYALPTQTESGITTTYKTQYPPTTEGARILLPETQGFYPTSLERDGHPNQQPFPTFAVNNLLNSVEDPSFIDQLAPVPDFEPDFEEPDGAEASPSPSAPTATVEATEKPTAAPADNTNIPTAPSATEPIEPVHEPASLTESQPTDTTEAHPFISGGKGGKGGKGTGVPMAAQDVFLPLASTGVPASIKSRDDHPVPRKVIDNSSVPIETNKFYAGFFLGTQTNSTFSHPYTLTWSKGFGNASSFGMAVTHPEADKVSQGPPNPKIPGSPISNYVNPIGIQSVILSASELKESTALTVERPLPFSANAVLQPSPGSSSRITFPVVQGMGFVTGVYSNLQPLIHSGVFYQKIVSAGSPRPGIFKYRLFLEDQSYWLLYAIPDNGRDPDFRLESMTDARGPPGWSGTIQIAKNPFGPSGEKFYDNSSGVYATEANISGSVSHDAGTYSLSWTKGGKDAQNTPLLMFALPHHVESFDGDTKARATSIQLRTTTKGNATAVVGEHWTMQELDLPIDMGFAPWSPKTGNVNGLSDQAKRVILSAAPKELQEDMDGQTNINSMYFGGKALSKFATLIYTVEKLAGSPSLAKPALEKLKRCFARFVENKQQFPLVYDNVWKGVVSSASYSGDVGADFGNTLYNDHHFHYGYFIQAAAIIGSLDSSWIPANKDWVNMLIRDAGNSVSNDPYFPFSRGFDWFHGHSWAKGLFESFDGKDQESTSEDIMFAYALKMWGNTIGDASLEARGNLMLGVLRRTLQNYFLMESTNKNQPANFIGNKVTGILFENKCDHATYFGSNLEYIQGIHMLPILPSTAFARNKNFVTEEWNAMFAPHASTPAEKVAGGWKGVLFANLALIDPVSSWNFFAQPQFDYGAIDGGATRTWYLAYAAGLGGA